MNSFYINKRVNPKGLKKDEYDAIIIGAGIGGLVCGCYLAKAGMKVLMLEKNNKPGGYCTSFERSGFRFDAGIHGIGGMRQGTEFRELLEYIDVFGNLRFIKNECTDTVAIADKNLYVFSNMVKTIEELKESFPKERENLAKFFREVIRVDIRIAYARIKHFKSFANLLDCYFKDEYLKAFFSIFLGNIGLPADLLDCLAGIVFFREFIFGGGYYPEGGMGMFPKVLYDKFKEYGGIGRFSILVNKAMKYNSKIRVFSEKENFICQYLINDGDGINFYSNILETNRSEKCTMLSRMVKLNPAISAFTLNIGLDQRLASKEYSLKYYRNVWYSDTIFVNRYYRELLSGKINTLNIVFLISIPSLSDRTICPDNSEILNIVTGAPYKDFDYWVKCKYFMEDRICKALNILFPDIKGHAILKISNTPIDFEKYSLNHKGSIHGWSSLSSQTESNLVPYYTFDENIFMVGQWVTQLVGSGGINTVAYTGKRTASIILKKMASG